MTLQVICPGCNTVYKVAENLLGKRIRCKKCQKILAVTAPKKSAIDASRGLRSAPAAARPRATAPAKEAATVKRHTVAKPGPGGDKKRLPGKKSTALPLLLAGGGVAALLLFAATAVGGYFLWSRSAGKHNAQAAPVVAVQPAESLQQPVQAPAMAATSGKEEAQQAPVPVAQETRPDQEATRAAPVNPPPVASTAGPAQLPDVQANAVPVSPAKPAPAVPPPADKPAVVVAPPPAVVASPKPSKPAKPAQGSDIIRDQTLQQIKDATVFIRVEAPPSFKGSGSGFVIFTAGDTGHIVTNHHVISGPDEKTPASNITCVFRSGTKREATVPAQVVLSDAACDLAVLKVTGMRELPTPIDLRQKVKPAEQLPVFSFGFPFGKALATNKGNPTITVGKATITGSRRSEHIDVPLLQIDGTLNPGNSGGPLVDSQGRLIGVAVAKITHTTIGMAIPADEVIKRVFSQVSDVKVTTLTMEGSMASLRAEAHLVDPMQRVKTVALHYLPGQSSEMPAQLGPDGSWPLLARAQKVELKVNGTTAVAEFQIPAGDSNPVYLYQMVLNTGDGRPTFSLPGSFRIEGGNSAVATLDPVDRTAPRAAGKDKLSGPATDLIKNATVHVKAEGDGFSALGTGFLVWTEGGTGYVVTNHNMIRPPRERVIIIIPERRRQSIGPGRSRTARAALPTPGVTQPTPQPTFPRTPSPTPPAVMPRTITPTPHGGTHRAGSTIPGQPVVPAVPTPPAVGRATPQVPGSTAPRSPVVAHVIVLPASVGYTTRVNVTFWSGTPQERTVSAHLVAGDPASDVAVLQVDGFAGLPRPLNAGMTPELTETQPLYFFGFPLSRQLGNNISMRKGAVSALRVDEHDELAFVQMDAEVSPGNGGGPVVDSQGRLVGMVRAAIEDSHINLVTPASKVHDMFDGWVHEARVTRAANGEFQITAHIFDPMKKLHGASVLYVSEDVVKEPPKPSDLGVWSQLPNARRAELRIDGNNAVATLQIPGRPNEKFYFQVTFNDGAGKPVYTKPMRD